MEPIAADPRQPGRRGRFNAGTARGAMMLLACALAFAYLQRLADRAYQSEILLSTAATNLHAMNGLEWEVLATRRVTAEVDAQLRAAREKAEYALDALLLEPGAIPATAAMENALHSYVNFISNEMALIRQGRIEDAERLDAQSVDPLYEFLSDSIEQLAIRYHEQAIHTGRIALGGSLLTVLAALLAMAYLAGHVQSARRDVAVAQAEQRVRQEGELRYKDLFEANPHPMWVIDIETTRFLAVNAAAIERYGYSRDEFFSMTLKEVRPFDDPEVLARDSRAWHGSAHHHAPSQHRTKDGSVFQAEVDCRRLVFGGRQAALSLIQDVSDRVRLEEELRTSHKLEAVGRLAGGVAHDFNNILTGISGFAQLLATGFSDEGHSKQRRYAEEIIASTRRAAGLTQQLLAYSRRQVLRAEVLDLNAFLNNMQHALQPVVGSAIRIEVRRASDLWPIRIDPAQLEQVILSLAGHARDSMPQGGTLTLETGNALLEGSQAGAREGLPPGEYVTIAVSDTGPGTSEEARTRIFDPFFSEWREGPGASLGLAIVHGIVKQSGGSITVESAPDRGTTFRLLIPRAPAEIAVESAAAGLARLASALEEPSGNGRNVA